MAYSLIKFVIQQVAMLQYIAWDHQLT